MKNMLRKGSVLVILTLWVIAVSGQAEKGSGAKLDPRTYMYGDYVLDFDLVFSSDKNKNNFALVRKYLEDKNEIEILIQELVLEYGHKVYRTDMTLTDYLMNFSKELQKYHPDDQVVLGVMMNKPFACYNGSYSIRQIKEYIIPDIERKFRLMVESDSVNVVIYDRLKRNLQLVLQDKWETEYMINDLLEPEMRQQSFRVMVSFGFMLLIASLLFTFFFVVYRKSNSSVYLLLLGGNGLQFVTIFVLIISIIIFGILGILGGTELAAILSGISGYVLGKNIKGDKDYEKEKLTEDESAGGV